MDCSISTIRRRMFYVKTTKEDIIIFVGDLKAEIGADNKGAETVMWNTEWNTNKLIELSF